METNLADFIGWPTSGNKYHYWFLPNPLDTATIKPHAGNYMFVKPTNEGWIPVYVGIAENLRDGIPNHEKWKEAVKLGATNVMAHTQNDSSKRKNEEKDLIEYWNPPLNSQHRTQASLLGS